MGYNLEVYLCRNFFVFNFLFRFYYLFFLFWFWLGPFLKIESFGLVSSFDFFVFYSFVVRLES